MGVVSSALSLTRCSLRTESPFMRSAHLCHNDVKNIALLPVYMPFVLTGCVHASYEMRSYYATTAHKPLPAAL